MTQGAGFNKAMYESPKVYQRIKLLCGVAEWLLGAALLAVILMTDLGKGLERNVTRWIPSPLGAYLLYCLLLASMEIVLSIPLQFYSEFRVEHKFGLSNQSLMNWLWEGIKSLAVSLLLVVPVLIGFYACWRALPDLWWLPVGGFIYLFSVLLARVAPSLIFPLFYKFEPLENGALKQRLRAMAEKEGLNVGAVFRFNLSKNTRKANAAFTGLGRTKRVLLADTLLDQFGEDEIMAVTAHELGHTHFHHIWKSSFIGALAIFGTLALSAWMHRVFCEFLNMSAQSLASLPLLLLLLMGLGLITAPWQNGISRHFEKQADDYAVDVMGDTASFIASLEKLASLNKADPSPHPWVEFFFYSHPSIGRRIKRLSLKGKAGP